MAAELVPAELLHLIAKLVPQELHAHILIVGSLAAAYHHREALARSAIATKDADIIIHPAGAVAECREIALGLLGAGWRRIDGCHPLPSPEPASDLRAIRLSPPTGEDFFVEILGFPAMGQAEYQTWVPCELDDGWYGLPTFRFLGLVKSNAKTAKCGLAYAAPEMMCLSNLLSHPTIGTATMGSRIGGLEILRSAKDLGRVLGLSKLATLDEIERWPDAWADALTSRFGNECKALAARAGNGVRELLDDDDALDQARHTLEFGLLAGHNVTVMELRALGRQLLVGAIDPLAERLA